MIFITDNGKETAYESINHISEAIKGKSNINIRFGEGKYYVDKTIILKGKNITFSACQKAKSKPRLIGGKLIKGWEHYKDGIYSVSVGDLKFNRLYEDGKAAVMARYPSKNPKLGNGPFLRAPMDTMKGYDHQKEFRFNDDVPKFDWEKGAKVYAMPAAPAHGGIDNLDIDKGLFSYTFIAPISNLDWDKRIISVPKIIRPENDAFMSMGYGIDYFLQGALEFLTEPGEFFLDNKAKKLYYKPMDSIRDINELEIIVPLVRQLISIEESSDVTIRGLQLEVTDNADIMPMFQGVGDPNKAIGCVVSLYSVSNVTIESCNIYNSGESGIMVHSPEKKGSSYVNILNNNIRNIGYIGVNLADGDNDNFIIKNNLLTDIGQVNGYSYGFGSWGCTNLGSLRGDLAHSSWGIPQFLHRKG